MKKNQTYKFSSETIERLNRLSTLQGDSKAFILETALKDYEEKFDDNRKDFMELWEKLNQNIQNLELKRDYHPDTGKPSLEEEGDEWNKSYLNEEETKVLNFYHSIWDEFRKQPFFSEIIPPELEDDF